jgi:lipoprotein-releasing system permease protein
LNFEFLISKKLISQRAQSKQKASRGTQTIIRIAVGGIILSVIVMIAALAIVKGFQKEIREKVIGFGSHIRITAFSNNHSDQAPPINRNQSFYSSMKELEGIRNIQVYALKEGIVKSEQELYGLMVKGIDTDFDWTFFSKNLIGGEIINISDTGRSDQIILSKKIAQKLNVSLGDKLIIYFFVNDKIRPRVFYLSGIYESGIEQLDELIALCDIKHIQRLNDWQSDMVGGFEVILRDYAKLDLMDEYIYQYIGENLNTVKITDQHRDIFSWLELQDINVIIIIILMVLVSGINMSSALVILILERTTMIGILKSLGSTNWSIRKIFLYHAAYLITVGVFWGNLIGLGLCAVQKYFGIIKLPKEAYYVSEVPIYIDWSMILLINLGTTLLCLLMLIVPSYLVSKISAVKAIRFQ